MRELPIVLPDGTMDDCTAAIVQACMMYPDDFASVWDDVDAYRVRKARGFPKSEMGQFASQQFRSAAKTGGLLAGAVLFKMAVFRGQVPKCGFNKAIFLVEDELNNARSRAAKDVTTIKKAFVRFKNASHLWAAMSIVAAEGQPIFPVDFIRVMQVAEQLRELTLDIVENWDPWLVPDAVPPIVYDPGVPDDDDWARIRRYRAKS